MKRKLIIAVVLTIFLGLGVVWAYEIQITLPIGSKTATVNGKPIKLDVPAQIIDGRTVVPLRFVTEALGGEVQWNEQERSVYIWQKRSDSIAVTLNKMETELSSQDEIPRSYSWKFEASKKYFRVIIKYMINSETSEFFYAITGPNGEKDRFLLKPNSVPEKKFFVETRTIETMGNKEFRVMFDKVTNMEILDVKILESDLPTFP